MSEQNTSLEATGTSQNLSFDEAYKHALDQLWADVQNYPDQMLQTELVKVETRQGGIGGWKEMIVTIRGTFG